MKISDSPRPKRKEYSGPAILALGFRPFFLAAGLWAPIGLILSLAMMAGLIPTPAPFDPLSWHIHEMMFGYVIAAIAGFLLTAIPNWTGRLPVQGNSLLGLAAIWMTGRLAMGFAGQIGGAAAAVLDVAFTVTIAAVAAREVYAGRNWRNFPIIGAILLLTAANVVMHLEANGILATDMLGARMAIAIVAALITLVGGRIIPSFTRNWLVKRDAAHLPAPFGIIDRITILVTIAALLLWVALPDEVATAVAAGLAAVMNALRLARWQGLATLSDALVWVLHLGYLWLPVGLGLMAAGHWWPAIPATGAIHALTVGLFGTMTLAVMSRATMGHTGRALHAPVALTLAFILVSVAATLRISATLWPEYYATLLAAAELSWIGAFILFIAVCGPMMIRPGR
jgi:uncharacterized protein involved in response to NO